MKTILLLAAALSFGITLSAEPVSTLKPFGAINDFAGVLNNASIAQLEQTCREVEQRAHAQIMVVTVKSLDGANVYDYSLSLFKHWGIGRKATNRGVLILVATGDHRYRITVGKGLDSILAEGNVSGFGLEAVPLLRRGDYGGALSIMTSRVADVIAQDAGIAVPALELPAPQPVAAYPQPTPQPVQREDNGNGVGAVLFVILICAIVAMAIWRRAQSQTEPYPVGNNPSISANSYGVNGGSVFTNSASASALWAASDSDSGGGSMTSSGPDNSSSFDSGSSSCGGGDTSGGGAGGSW